ncbi:Regulatory protein AtoC [subsurface metagenome]
MGDRANDIAVLAGYFLNLFSGKYEKPLLRFNSDAIEELKNYSWPGNVRELKHTIERAVILSENHILTPADFALKETETENIDFKSIRTLEKYEKDIIRHVLRKHNGNISNTAGELNIGRQTLYRKINKYGI